MFDPYFEEEIIREEIIEEEVFGAVRRPGYSGFAPGYGYGIRPGEEIIELEIAEDILDDIF